MSREPSFPKDAAVGGGPEDAAMGGGGDGTADGGVAAKAGPNRNKHLATGAAIGIGSAAIVAALLYANRSRKSDRSES